MGARLGIGMVAGAACGMILSMLFGFGVGMGLIFGAAMGIVVSTVIPDRKPRAN